MYTLNVYENDWSYIEFLFDFFVRRHKNHLWILQNNSHKKKLLWNNLLMIWNRLNTLLQLDFGGENESHVCLLSWAFYRDGFRMVDK